MHRGKRWLGALASAVVALGLVAGPASASTLVVGAGDIGKNPSSTATACSGAVHGTGEQTTKDMLSAYAPGRVLVMGDGAYSEGTYDQWYCGFGKTWGSLGYQIKAAPGDHDYLDAVAADCTGLVGSPTEACGFLKYFGRSKTWNAYDYQGYRFVQLDSHEFDKTAQLNFLQDEIDNAVAPIIVYFATPRWSSGDPAVGGANHSGHGPDTDVDTFWDIMYDGGSQKVKLVINGHEHFYERFGLMTNSGTLSAANGIRQITVGTGGASNSYQFGTPATGSQKRWTEDSEQNANSNLALTGTYANTDNGWGVLVLTLGATSLDWAFYAGTGANGNEGTLLDSGSQTV